MQVYTHVVGSDLNMNAPNKSKTWGAVIWGLCLAAGTYFVEQQIETYFKTHDELFGYPKWNGLSSDEKDAAREIARELAGELAPDKHRNRLSIISTKDWWEGKLKNSEKGAVWVRIKERAKEIEKRGPARDYWEGVDPRLKPKIIN